MTTSYTNQLLVKTVGQNCSKKNIYRLAETSKIFILTHCLTHQTHIKLRFFKCFNDKNQMVRMYKTLYSVLMHAKLIPQEFNSMRKHVIIVIYCTDSTKCIHVHHCITKVTIYCLSYIAMFLNSIICT